jgi:aryl-alcohol dehydrogenase-like predicted oxidoreductase
MDYARLGTSGLRVSRIALGCMSFGVPRPQTPWTLDEEDAEQFFRQAVELGITLWDTANIYGNGSSEEFVGRAIRKYSRREDIVLATKLGLKSTTALPDQDSPAGRSWKTSTCH